MWKQKELKSLNTWRVCTYICTSMYIHKHLLNITSQRFCCCCCKRLVLNTNTNLLDIPAYTHKNIGITASQIAVDNNTFMSSIIVLLPKHMQQHTWLASYAYTRRCNGVVSINAFVSHQGCIFKSPLTLLSGGELGSIFMPFSMFTYFFHSAFLPFKQILTRPKCS